MMTALYDRIDNMKNQNDQSIIFLILMIFGKSECVADFLP